MLKFDRPPPENRSRSPSSCWFWKSCCSACWLALGMEMLANTRNATSKPPVKRILFRSSGSRRALYSASSRFMSALLRSFLLLVRRPAGRLGAGDRQPAAPRLDGSPRRLAGGVRRDRQPPPQASRAKQLHRHPRPRQPGLRELPQLDGGAVLEAVQLGQVDHRVDPLERVLEAAQLGQPLGERHLAALEAEPEALAARALPLLAATRRLAPAGAGAAAEPLLPRAGALGRPQLVQLHL